LLHLATICGVDGGLQQMREEGREQPQAQQRVQVRQGEGCLDVLIHQHGNEHINTLAQLITLTTSVEHSLEHSGVPYR